jgi:hypothetical protein
MKILFMMVLPFIFSSCAAYVEPGGTYVSLAPPLPATVEVLIPYSHYVHAGFHYYYHNDRWYYSKARGGRLRALPRNYYPRELVFKDRRDRRIWKEERGRNGRDYRRDFDERRAERYDRDSRDR